MSSPGDRAGNSTRHLEQMSDLESLRVFRGVDLTSIWGLLEKCPLLKLSEGEVLLKAGQKNRFVYLILSGHLWVRLKPGHQPIATLEPGEVTGEISVLEGKPTTANVVAKDDCTLLRIDEQTFWSLIDACPGFSLNLLLILAQRLRGGDSSILQAQEMEEEYQRHAILDPATGLYNRRWLGRRFSEEMHRVAAGQLPLALLLIGVDHHRSYQDTHGSEAADRAVYCVAWALKQVVGPDGMLARLAADQFLLLLPEHTLSQAKGLAVRLCEVVARTEISGVRQSRLPSVKVSIAATEVESGETLEDILEAAERTLVRAREKGGGRVFGVNR